jgi:hydroxymethylglutaryl-CoA reductase
LDVARGMVEACTLALIDPYRAATHNKGIMNGIDPVVVATGNDWRAIEAGAHAYACRDGRYTSLSNWELSKTGKLVGTIAMPMALGLVGGATRTHPAAQAALKLLNVKTAGELAEVTAAVGLAQNMAALRALSTEGIQRGHMALHARNIAISAGASGADIDRVAKAIVAAGDVSVARAEAELTKS